MEKSEEEVAWEKERDINIELVDLSDREEYVEFVRQNCYPDEPLCASCEVLDVKGWFDRQMLAKVDELFVHEPLELHQKNPACMVARCTRTGKVVGIRTAEVINKDSFKKEPSLSFLADMPKFIPVPKKLRKQANLQKVWDAYPLGKNHVFGLPETEDSKTIYFGHLVCVGREARGKGLGMEMIKRSHKLAEKAGCTHTYIIATGKFSQRIFQKLGYHVKFEMKYADHEQDKHGRPFIHKHGEHEVLKMVLFDHKS